MSEEPERGFTLTVDGCYTDEDGSLVNFTVRASAPSFSEARKELAAAKAEAEAEAPSPITWKGPEEG